MKSHTGYGRTLTDESLRETVRHGSEEYPFQYYLEDIWLFDFHCIDWHWHSEVELVLLEKGKAECLIGSDRYVLQAGMGIFINSQVIHRFEATESAIIPNAVFSPLLLAREESLIYRKYIRPVLDSSRECLIFSPDDPEQKDILDTMKTLFTLQKQEDAREIETLELLLRLWRKIWEEPGIREHASVPRSSIRTQAQLQIMLQYIHKNYPHPISLEDIAGTVTLSKSSVLNIFNKNIHTSPISYLVNYRLRQAAGLLTATEDSVCSIARNTGFENVGYFCRKFKEIFRMTPGEYRKKER